MCEFCKINKPGKDYVKGDLLDESTFDLGIFPNLRVQTKITGKTDERKIMIYMHLHQEDDDDFDESEDYPIGIIDIPIKYCPRCGRKL